MFPDPLKVQSERQKINQEAQQQQQIALRKKVQESREVLSHDIPGWSDETYNRILKSAVDKLGFNPEEVSTIYDARAIKALYYADQYLALKANPPSEKKVTPSAPKVAKPGAGVKPDAKGEARKAHIAKFRKTGKIQDALPLAEEIAERYMLK